MCILGYQAPDESVSIFEQVFSLREKRVNCKSPSEDMILYYVIFYIRCDIYYNDVGCFTGPNDIFLIPSALVTQILCFLFYKQVSVPIS